MDAHAVWFARWICVAIIHTNISACTHVLPPTPKDELGKAVITASHDKRYEGTPG